MFGAIAAILAITGLLVFLFRTTIATAVVGRALASQGIRSDIAVDSIDFGGAVAHGSLSRPGLQVAMDQVTVQFDPHHWLPRIQKITIVRPVVTIDLRKGTAFKSESGSGSLGDVGIDVSSARIIALTDAGRIEIAGDALISNGKPEHFNGVLLPAHLHSGVGSADIKAGQFSGTAAPRGMHVQLHVIGNVSFGQKLQLEQTEFDLDIPIITWNNKLAAKAPSATLWLAATGQSPWSARAQLSAVQVDTSRKMASAEVTASAKGSLPPDVAHQLVSKLPLLAGDRHTAGEIQTALQSLTAHARFSWRMVDKDQELRLLEAAEVKGADTVQLRIMPSLITLHGSIVSGSLAVSMRAPGVPRLDLTMPSFAIQPGALDATLSLKGGMSFGPLRDGDIDAQATVQGRSDILEVRLQRCANLKLGRYLAKRGDMLSNTTAALCAAGDKPLLRASRKGWKLEGEARSVNATLPLTGLRISHGNAQLSIAGTAATPKTGIIHVAAMVSDSSKKQRLAPEKITGTVTIAGTTIDAELILGAGPQAISIGTVSAIHHLDTGTGTATIEFPAIGFSPSGLQPVEILPLFSTLAQANGTAKFSGHVTWNTKRITSKGQLDVESLRFSSPLGLAQQLSTHMAFTSLLPPITAPNQRIAIERVDWVQPLTRSTTAVTLTPTQLRVADTRTEITGGEVSITTLDVPLRTGTTFHGTVQISHLALGKLIAASNLGEKLKLEGTVSGSLPFTFGPDGLHFANGHIEADGPGRLSINHTLWGKGDTNSVEKAAYQALENLSYQSLSATLESVPGGRLRAVFHVVGYDDGPGTPHTEFKLTDLLTGKAFQKEIPIPRGTAINLTLDTSLNFDELLRGYQATWSQMKALNGASP